MVANRWQTDQDVCGGSDIVDGTLIVQSVILEKSKKPP